MCAFGSVGACFCVKGGCVSVRECVCVCERERQPKQVYRRFHQREYILWVRGTQTLPAPQPSASFSFPAPLLLLAFDEFGAYFLAESLGHVFGWCWKISSMEPLKTDCFSAVWLEKEEEEKKRVVQDKLEDFKFSWWTLRIHKEGKSWDRLGPGPCLPAIFVFSCLFLEIRRQFRSAFLKDGNAQRRTHCVTFGGCCHAKGIISVCVTNPPSFFPCLHLLFI